ncbi:MAG: hypothetical protein AB1295_05820 [Candidatus Micrarchaeota archaeon]
MEEKTEEQVTEEVKEAAKERSNVKCSFCGNDAFCGSCADNPDKAGDSEHMCYDCYQRMGEVPENVRDKTHVCMAPEQIDENFRRFMDEVTHRAFQDLWDSKKKELKEMSRQELALTSFFEGASFMFQLMQRMSQQPPAGSGPPASGTPPSASGSEDGETGNP